MRDHILFRLLLVLVIIVAMGSTSIAQTAPEPKCNTQEILSNDENYNYNRSSLHLVLIESESFPRKEPVMNAWKHFPFPDKYDDHHVDLISFNPNEILLSEEEIKEAGYSTDENVFEITMEDISAGIYDPRDKYMNLKIEKVIEETELAKQLVAKWFGFSQDTTFDMQLVQERGYYNASDLDVKVAQNSKRGRALLADAGEELINNTFVVFSKLYFSPNELIAKVTYDKAIQEVEKINNRITRIIARRAAKKAYDEAKKGYSVWTLSWLYKLKWDETVANTFYRTMWNNPQEFYGSDIFEMEYIGRQGSRSVVTFSLTENRTENEIIDVATVRNIDNTYAKLQKEYDVFKPKVPVFSSQPLTAQIGLKEGLEGGERFEVLEMKINCDTFRTEYDLVDRVRVDESMIWDNRYKAGLEENISSLNASHFTGANGKVEIGMLLKQIK